MTSTVCASDPSLLRESGGTDRSDSRHLKSSIQPLNQLQPHQHSTFRRLLPLVWYLSIWLLHLTRTDSCRMLRQVKKVFVSVNPSSVLIGLAFLLLALPSLLIAAPATSSSHYDRCFTRTLSPSTVKIKYGSLRGLIVHLSSSTTFSSSTSSINPPHPRLAPMEAFLGVPYASPPTGALRFMPPVTPGHWHGIRRATRLAPLCPQRLSPAESLTHLANGTDWFRRLSHRATNQSEDCLYLNIYTPILDLDSIGKADNYRGKEIVEDDDEEEEETKEYEIQADESKRLDEEEEEEVRVDSEEDEEQMRQRRSLEDGLARVGQRHYRHHNTKSPTSSSSGRSSRSAESFADRRAQSGLPVLVLLSSESYSVNMATLFDGSLLASYGQVLVVTLNYRIGILGYLSSQVDGFVRGNYGLLDVVAALHWLQQNIAAFGGQATNVTLLGHGHGAAMAHILALSPMAKGLFNRVVLLSGSALAPWAIARDALEYGRQVAKQLNCPTEPSVQMVDCLRTVSVASLLSVTVPVPDYLSSFGPTLDAIVIPTEPRVAMTAAVIGRGSRAEEARNIATSSGGSNSSSHHRLHGHLSSSNSPSNPSASSSHLPPDYLLGVTRVECPPIFTPTEEAVGLTVARRDRILRTLVRNSFDFHQQAIFHTLVNEYTEWSRPVEQPTAILDSLVELLGDGQTVAPTTEAADHVAALSQASLLPRSSKTAVPSPRVFFFVFAPSPGNLPSHSSRFYSRVGAPHGTDLAYLLGIPLLPPPPSPNSCASSSPTRFPTLDIVPTSPISPHGTYNDSQVELAKTMIRYFVNFAAFGDPNVSPPSSSLSSSPSTPLSLHLRRLSLLHFSHVRNLVNSLQTSSSPTSANWPLYDTAQKKYLLFGSQVSTRDHYRSHQLSIWLSLIPRLTIASELEAKKSSNEKAEGDDEEKDADEEALDPSSQFYLRHHLLADHENPDTYEGTVKQVQVSGLTRGHRRLMRTNLSAPLDWHQAMLYGRLNSLKGVTGRKLPVTRGGTVRTAVDGTVLSAAEEVANNGKEQFAGRRAEEKAAGGLPAGKGLAGKGEDGPKKKAPEEDAEETSFDVVHFSPPGTDKILSYETQESNENYSTALLVTIVVGTSLLVLNILIFLGVYYQLDGRSDRNKTTTIGEEDEPREELSEIKDNSLSPMSAHRGTNHGKCNSSKPQQQHSQVVITSRSHNSSSVSYSVLSKATSDKGPTGNSCATLPNRRSRLSTQSPRTGRSEQVSTLTRIRPNPTEQYLVEDTTVNKEQTEPTLYYLHYTPTPSPYETVPAMCTYEKTSLPTVCLEHSAHCTPLKSILKNTTQGPLFVTPGDSLTAEQQAAFVSTPSSGVILDGTVHYVSAPLQQAEYVDGGNFLTFFPPPPPPT